MTSPYLSALKIVQPETPPAPKEGSHETADAFRSVIFLSDDNRFRIIACSDPYQWIVQMRRSYALKTARPWKAVGFCTTKVGLERVIRSRRLASEGLAEFMAGLPHRFLRPKTEAA